MFCSYCGSENANDAKFCNSCGKEAILEPSTPVEKTNVEDIKSVIVESNQSTSTHILGMVVYSLLLSVVCLIFLSAIFDNMNIKLPLAIFAGVFFSKSIVYRKHPNPPELLNKYCFGFATILVLGIMGIQYYNNEIGSEIQIKTSSNVHLYNCEQHTIRQCKEFSYYKTDCLFTNNSTVRVAPNALSVWYYDKNGIFLDKGSVSSSVSIPPGQTVHILVSKRKDTYRSVICSMDPNSNFVGGESKWTKVQ